MVSQVKDQLVGTLIPFWKSMRDENYGGYYGYLGYDLKLDPYAVKGCILNSRILWFFSNAWLLLRDDFLLAEADHAWQFMNRYCVDRENGGVYWSVTYDGKVEDSTKHTYNQAFAIYALASYYDASGNREALLLAENLYQIVEKKCRDENGYLEAFDVHFCPESNEKLSENGVMAERTMNTLLHVFEAYTELYRVTGSESVADSIRSILDTLENKVFNPDLGRLEVFFDRSWHSLIDLYSYGHDIEAAWLIDRGLEVLGDEEYTRRLRKITRTLTENIYRFAYENHSLPNEAENGVKDTTRVWWVQAEAVVGFINGFQKTPEKTEYLDAAQDIWQYIRDHVVDRRDHSEWFWALDAAGNPLAKPVVEPWKCPYHNGRMCLEVIKRLDSKD